MNAGIGNTPIKVPTSYQEWLACFDVIKKGTGSVNEVFDAVVSGSFNGTDLTKNALQNQIVETVNVFLNKRVKRFRHDLNESFACSDLPQIELLFKRLKKDIAYSLFFTKLSFLPADFRSELENSVKTQMSDIWCETIAFLYDQSLEFPSSGLEDVLFLVKRIKLF